MNMDERKNNELVNYDAEKQETISFDDTRVEDAVKDGDWLNAGTSDDEANDDRHETDSTTESNEGSDSATLSQEEIADGIVKKLAELLTLLLKKARYLAGAIIYGPKYLSKSDAKIEEYMNAVKTSRTNEIVKEINTVKALNEKMMQENKKMEETIKTEDDKPRKPKFPNRDREDGGIHKNEEEITEKDGGRPQIDSDMGDEQKQFPLATVALSDEELEVTADRFNAILSPLDNLDISGISLSGDETERTRQQEECKTRISVIREKFSNQHYHNLIKDAYGDKFLDDVSDKLCSVSLFAKHLSQMTTNKIDIHTLASVRAIEESLKTIETMCNEQLRMNEASSVIAGCEQEFENSVDDVYSMDSSGELENSEMQQDDADMAHNEPTYDDADFML